VSETRRSVLIVDDDREIRDALAEFFGGAGWRAQVAASGADAMRALAADPPDIIISDMRMPRMSGLELHAEIKRFAPDLPVIIVTAHGDIPMAVEATRAGAAEFIEKPYDPEQLLDAAERCAAKGDLQRQNDRLRARLRKMAGLDAALMGESNAIRALREDVADVAATDASVLILGETGAGKELVARALHDMSQRAAGPFTPVNCGAIPDGLFESTMFGHLKGSFTGASEGRPGAFRSADKGTLFLDELGACAPDHQAKLLRALEAREVTPVGASAPKAVDIRVISATNAELLTPGQPETFRSDLYYRVSTVILRVPPLRTRGEDVILLFAAFLEHFSKVYEIDPPEISDDDRTTLLSHHWPGNVRELRHVAERRALAARRGRGSVREALDSRASASCSAPLREQMDAYERMLLVEALERVEGTMDDVAQQLGIGRRTLNEKLVRHGISRR